MGSKHEQPTFEWSLAAARSDEQRQQPGEITALLDCWRDDPRAAERLAHVVYPQLRRIAARQLAGEVRHDSFQLSDLVHEALLPLLCQRRARFRNRRHFFAIAAHLIRRVLVARARQRQTLKRGCGLRRVELDVSASCQSGPGLELLALDDALRDLEAIDPQTVRVIELRYFTGLSIEETASALDLGRVSVVRRWRRGRAWLEDRLRGVTAIGAEL